MGNATAVRRLTGAAALGGGGLSVLGGALYVVLRAQAGLARKAIGTLDTHVPDSSGWYGRSRPGPAIKIALLGDSSAAGYGVRAVEETPGAWLGSGVSERAERRVNVREYAVVGAQSSNLDAQISAALLLEPDVAVILIGANDVTHSVLPAVSVRHLSAAVRRLVEAGVAVVVGTCPDLGTISPIPIPLRQVARTWSRKLAAAQTVAVVEAGGRTVSLGSVLGPEFAAAPALLFGPDQFHPSAAGYEALARTMVPSILAAVGMVEDEEDPAASDPWRGSAPDRGGRRTGEPEPRHRDRRHRGGRSPARGRRPLGHADASGACCRQAARSRPATSTSEESSGEQVRENDDAPAGEPAEASNED